jgi:two-component system CheB/CheR fusion protein
MPVTQVMERTKVEPNSVYVIPPAKQLSMQDGHLTLSDLKKTPDKRVAVDVFFRTLADTHGQRARAIVLSGSDSDGAIGIKRIKEMGGLTVAQDPNEAPFDGMPRAAIATGMVDWVLPVAEIPGKLATYQQNENRVRLPSEIEPSKPGQVEDREPGDEAALRDVLSFLRVSTGRDFAYYKRATVLRRLARRMQVNSVLDLPGYLEFLRTHPQEAGALLQDLLISVTNFFRDKSAFVALENDLPRLFEGRKSSDRIRVWVAGCATGEEAYSIAMLMSDHTAKLNSPPRFQVFATDIDEQAINAARDGAYPETIAADVSDERLRRYFVREHQVYRVRRSLLEMVLFAVHDLLRDFPFSRIDLVSCRNLLIYLDRSAQTRALETFHFALRPEGRLFLGTSESAEEGGSLFYPVEKKYRIYGRAVVPRATLPHFIESGPSAGMAPLHFPPGQAPLVPPSATVGEDALPAPAAIPRSWTEMHLKLIEEIARPSLIIDQNQEIVHLSKKAGDFLKFVGGEPSTNLLRVVNPALRVDLRTALFRAQQSNSPVEVHGLRTELDGTKVTIQLTIRPIPEIGPGYFLVLFGQEEQSPVPPGTGELPHQVTHLEEEIEQVKGQLRDTIQQYEIGSEELKASNEELQAMNEELRSATEELETSREELQSINEELTTVNQELKSKVEEVSRANSDLQNLISSTDIGTIFLDRDLLIKRYTPSAVPLFNLIPSDIGRPLSDLKARFDYPGLSADAGHVLENLSPIEREVRSAEQWFLMRLLPYRTTEDQIAGVVLTFVDITHRKSVEEALRSSQSNLTDELKAIENLHEMTMRLLNTSDLAATLKEILAAVTTLNDTDLGSVHLFDTGSELLSLATTAGLGDAFSNRHRSLDPAHDSAFARALKTGRRVVVEDYEKDPGASDSNRAAESGYRAIDITPLTTRSGERLGLMAIYYRQPHRPTEKDMQRTDLYARQAADLIERKRAEEILRRSEERIRVIVSQTTVGIGQTDLDGKLLYANRKLCELFGRKEEDLLGKNVHQLIPSSDWNEAEECFGRLLNGGKAFEVEKPFLREDGRSLCVNVSFAITRDEEQKPQSVLFCVTDITQRVEDQKALKEALEENVKARAEIEASAVAKDRFLAILSHELRTPLTPVLMTLETLGRRIDLPERVRQGLDMIRRNVQIEAHFIDDLLDVTRITRDKFEIVRHPMDVHKAIGHAIEISESDILGKRQRLTVHLDAEKHEISGDCTRIQQIVWNVLKNSSKFSPEETEIRISTRNEGDQIVVSVTDFGIGIDPKILPHIFDPFVQGGESVSREFGGLGLGLAISKATIDAHGGRLLAESNGRNQGATFTIFLPLLEFQS